jgi:hypothetical protein
VTAVTWTRRREERKAAQLARLLASLEQLAADERRWRPRRVVRLSLGSTRY